MKTALEKGMEYIKNKGEGAVTVNLRTFGEIILKDFAENIYKKLEIVLRKAPEERPYEIETRIRSLMKEIYEEQLKKQEGI